MISFLKKNSLIILGILVFTAVLIYYSKDIKVALFGIGTAGAAVIGGKLKKEHDEIKAEEQKILAEVEQKKEEIKVEHKKQEEIIISRPKDEDIATLSPETQEKIEDIKKNTTNSIIAAIKAKANKNG